MTILHIVWCRGQLWVWGEGEYQNGVDPPCSPYALDAAGLRDVIARLRGVSEDRVEAVETLAIELPSCQAEGEWRPVTSLQFLSREMASEPVECVSRRWQVWGIRLGWRAIMELLVPYQERSPGGEIFLSEGYLLFGKLLGVVGSMVARGRFLPGVRRGEGMWEAVWQPVVGRVEWSTLAESGSQLPAAALDGVGWERVVGEVVEEWVDRLVRMSVVTTLTRAHARRGTYSSVHDAWMAALRGESRVVRWDKEGELGELARVQREWSWPVVAEGVRRPAFVIELREPVGGRGAWVLAVVRATAANSSGGSTSQRSGSKGQGWLGELTLLALGQAAQLWPMLSELKLSRGELRSEIGVMEASSFAGEGAALLRAAGYRVVLPEWWHESEACNLAVRAIAVPRGGEVEDDDGVVLAEAGAELRWEVTIDGEVVSLAELEELAAAEAPLVYFRGKWRHIDMVNLQKALRVARSGGLTRHSADEVVRLALGASAGLYGLEVSGLEGEGWLKRLLEQFGGAGVEGGGRFETVLGPPEGFCGELRPYQLRGFNWLVHLQQWGMGGCLADDMGLGKTIQALALVLHQRAIGKRRPVLLIGPMSVLGNWVRECERFAPSLKHYLHHGPERLRGEEFAELAGGVDIVFTSYTLLYRDYSELRQVRWSCVIADEAQNIKNPATRQAQAARALISDSRVALTGTPLENHVGDLWSIMDFLNPGLLGKRSQFKERFQRPIHTGMDPGAKVRLRRITAPLILRRLKSDRSIITDLPPKVESKVYCPLSREQSVLYQEVLERFRHDLEAAEGISRRGLILGVLTRLKQVCNHPEHYYGSGKAAAGKCSVFSVQCSDGTKGLNTEYFTQNTSPAGEPAHKQGMGRSGKLARLSVMLREIFGGGESALIFTQYAAMGHLLQRYICHSFAVETPYLYGALTRREREEVISSFMNGRKPQAFVLSLKAGGTGLNLTRATHVIHFDRWWNPAVEDQATDRAYRIGQEQRVMVHKMICSGTLEDRIDAMIESKRSLADEIVSSGEQMLTELSDSEIYDVLQLAGAHITDEGDVGS